MTLLSSFADESEKIAGLARMGRRPISVARWASKTAEVSLAGVPEEMREKLYPRTAFQTPALQQAMDILDEMQASGAVKTASSDDEGKSVPYLRRGLVTGAAGAGLAGLVKDIPTVKDRRIGFAIGATAGLADKYLSSQKKKQASWQEVGKRSFKISSQVGKPIKTSTSVRSVSSIIPKIGK